MGEARLEEGAECEIVLGGGGIMCCRLVGSSNAALAATVAAAPWCCLLPLREFGLLCMRECLVSSSDLLKRFVHPGNWQA